MVLAFYKGFSPLFLFFSSYFFVVLGAVDQDGQMLYINRIHTKTVAACTGPAWVCTTWVTELIKEVDIASILNLEGISRWHLLANENLVFSEGVSLEKQTALKGRMNSQR